MTTISEYKEASLKEDARTTAERFEQTVYPITESVLNSVLSLCNPGPIIVFQSGSWRFNMDALFLEHHAFRNADLPMHKNTYFVDPLNDKMLRYVFTKHKAANIVILHSGLVTRYRPIDDIVYDLTHWARLLPNGDKVILSTPITRVSFNRLMITPDQLATKIGATLVDDSFIISCP